MKHSDVKDAIVDLLEDIVKRTNYINHHHPQKDLSLDIDLLKDDLRQLYSHFEYLKGIAPGPQLKKVTSGIAAKRFEKPQTKEAESAPAPTSEGIDEHGVKDKAPVEPEKMTGAGAEVAGEPDVDETPVPAVGETASPTPEETPSPTPEEAPSPTPEETPSPDMEETTSPELEEIPSPEIEATPSPESEEAPSPAANEVPPAEAEGAVSPSAEETPSPEAVEAAEEQELPLPGLFDVPPVSADEEMPADPVKEDTDKTSAKKTVNDILSIAGKKTIGDSYVETDKSLNQRISENKVDESIGARMQQQPVASIRDAIGVNEKFLFINELFDGDIRAYNDAIAQLNDMQNIRAAFDHLNSLGRQFSWDAQRSADTIEKLANYVQRRYM